MGATLRVSVQGRGRPLLLITGLGANVETWESLRRHLGYRFRTIAFDPPGIGRSTLPLRPRRMPGLADMVSALLDELGEERLDVLGVSWGGVVAQELALRRPERIRRLVLACTTCGLGGIPGHPLALLWLSNPIRHKLGGFEWMAALSYGGALRHDETLIRRLMQSRRQNPPTLPGYLAQLMAITGWTSLPRLHRIPHPTLVMSGDDDPIIPLANARILAARIPKARLHVVRGGGHMFLFDEARSSAATIANFLDTDAGES